MRVLYLWHGVVFEHEMEYGGPNEWEHATGEASDEPHEESEVGDHDSKQNRHHNHADAKSQAINL